MTRAHRLTPAGALRAKEHLAAVRSDPFMDLATPENILSDPSFAEKLKDGPEVHHLPIQSRRDAADYLTNLTPAISADLADDDAFWSWMGMYHLQDLILTPKERSSLTPMDETFVMNPMDQLSLRVEWRHCLRSAWLVADRYGDSAAFILDRRVLEFSEITRFTLQFKRIFNSEGIVPLILSLYTRGVRTRRGFSTGTGGVRHLVRVLDQLELTHDVYGMPAEALMEILPPEFDRWKA